MSNRTREVPQLADLTYTHNLVIKSTHEYKVHGFSWQVRALVWFYQTLLLKVPNIYIDIRLEAPSHQYDTCNIPGNNNKSVQSSNTWDAVTTTTATISATTACATTDSAATCCATTSEWLYHFNVIIAFCSSTLFFHHNVAFHVIIW